MSKRRERIDVFALGPQGFAAGRQDADMRRLLHDRLGQGSHRVDHVLAAVEQEKHVALAQVSDDVRGRVAAADGQAQGRCQRVGNRILIPRSPRSRKQTCPWKVSLNSLATARATVVLPIPPEPWMVTKRWSRSSSATALVSSSRSTIGVKRRGKGLPRSHPGRPEDEGCGRARGCSRDARSSIPDRQR